MSFTWRYAPFGKKNGNASSALSWRIASHRPYTPAVNVGPDALGCSEVCGSAPGSVAAAVVVVAAAVVVGDPDAAEAVVGATVVLVVSGSTKAVRRSTV